jgi:clan AA aspartic protease
MITGTVTADREAVIRLAVRDVNGQEYERDALVDTGFDGWLSLPPDFIAALGLRWQRFGRALLADGSATVFDIYEATILWDGQPRTISVYEMDAEPLVGMSLMYGYELVLPVLDGATFILRSIANP